MNWATLGGLGTLIPPKYDMILLKLAQVVVFKDRNRLLKMVLENSAFNKNCTSPNFDFFLKFCLTFGSTYPMKEAEIKKTKYFQEQTLDIGLSKHGKIKSLSGPNFSGKIRLKGAWSRVKGSKSKSHLPYLTPTILGHIPVKKVLPQHLPVLRL